MMASRRLMSAAAAASSPPGPFTVSLLPSRTGNLGIVELNNPSSLNALNLPMVRSLNHVLAAWRSDPSVRATLFVGAPGRNGRPAFCAGGDVKSVYEAGLGVGEAGGEGTKDHIAARQGQHGYGERGLLTADFFREEYIMNHRIATQDHDRVPQVSIWDGVVMGGGVGVSVHGKYRVATENSLFAMPETAIGLFPDVGGTWWLPRLRGGLGQFIALTGTKLRAEDLMYAGIATHYVPSDRLGDLRAALVEATSGEDGGEGGDRVAGALMSLHQVVEESESFLARHREEIDAAFGDRDAAVEDIVGALEAMAGSGSKFSADALEALRNASPTSLKVTHEGLRRGAAAQSIGEALQVEYRMAQGFVRGGSDFYEGVRALLVDKDKSPRWDPSSLEEVTDEVVGSYFVGLGENDLELEGLGSSKL